MATDWLLDTGETPDDLLALLVDDALAAPWWSPADGDVSPWASPLSSVESLTADVPQQPTQKRKKKRGRTQKDEIELLRRTVEDLESALSLRSRRRAMPKNFRPSGGESLSAWRRVATRQLQLLRDAQRENQRLRGQVQHRLAVLTRLRRLAERIQVPAERVPPTVLSLHATVFAYKRHELLAKASAVSASLDATAARLSRRLGREEFRDSVVGGRTITGLGPHAGGILAQSSVGRMVPRKESGLAQAVWEYYVQMDGVSPRYYRLEHVEHSSNSYVVGYSFSFPTPNGLAAFHGVGVRTRMIDGKRDASVLVASMWPHESTPSPFSAVGFNATATLIFQPHVPTREVAEPADEMLMHTVFSPLEYAAASQNMTREEALTLENFVVKARDHVVNEAQNLLDSLLLQMA